MAGYTGALGEISRERASSQRGRARASASQVHVHGVFPGSGQSAKDGADFMIAFPCPLAAQTANQAQ